MTVSLSFFTCRRSELLRSADRKLDKIKNFIIYHFINYLLQLDTLRSNIHLSSNIVNINFSQNILKSNFQQIIYIYFTKQSKSSKSIYIFKKNVGINHTLIQVADIIYGKWTMVYLLLLPLWNVQKVFDTVNHQIRLNNVQIWSESNYLLTIKKLLIKQGSDSKNT